MHKKISIIIPVFNEEKNIIVLIKRLHDIFSKNNYDYEIMIVNDGSHDNSEKVVINMGQNDKRVKLVNLSRNFGKEAAMSAGLSLCTSDAAVIIDADLQHPPELITEMIKRWEEGYPIVYAKRKKSKNEPFFRKIFSKIFYIIFNMISELKMEQGATDYRLLDKKIIGIINQMTERNRMFRGIIDWLGYESISIEFTPNKRLYGDASYSFKQLVKLAINSITSFSLWPLKALFVFGLVVTVSSFITLLLMPIFQFFIFEQPELFRTIAYVIVFQTFLSGVVLTALGLIAVYIGNIHYESLGRPMFIVNSQYNFEDENPKNE